MPIFWTDKSAHVRHKDTGQIFEIAHDQLKIHGERPSPTDEWVTECQFYVDHSDLGRLIWQVDEDPIGFIADEKGNMNGHELVEDFVFVGDDWPDPGPDANV